MFKYLHILASTISCVSMSALASLVCVPLGITSLAAGIKISGINAGMKKYKFIIKKKKKKHEKIVLIGKYKLNTIEVLICKALINSYISHDEFISVNNEMKEEKRNPENSVEYNI